MGLTACLFLFALALPSSSCASIFMAGRRRKPGGDPRKAERVVVMLPRAPADWEHSSHVLAGVIAGGRQEK